MVCFSLAVIAYASFTWAATAFFKISDENALRGKRIVSVFGLLATGTALYHLWQLRDHDFELSILIADIIFILSIYLFWWAILSARKARFDFMMSKRQPDFLQQAGAYKLVRHPFYLSYSLAWVAGVVATGSLVLAGLASALVALYVSYARQEERIILNSDLGHLYQPYVTRTGMFFPRLFKGRNSEL